MIQFEEHIFFQMEVKPPTRWCAKKDVDFIDDKPSQILYKKL